MCKFLFGKSSQLQKDLDKCLEEKGSLQALLDECSNEKGLLQIEIDQLEADNLALNSLITPPKAPIVYNEISSAQVKTMLREVFTAQPGRIFISDRKYRITSIDEIRRFIGWDNVNIFPYVAEWHDCDDFAIALNGDFAKYPGWSAFPVALVWADYGIGAHAFCLTIAWESLNITEPHIYYIEPQNDHEIAAESMEGADLQLMVI